MRSLMTGATAGAIQQYGGPKGFGIPYGGTATGYGSAPVGYNSAPAGYGAAPSGYSAGAAYGSKNHKINYVPAKEV